MFFNASAFKESTESVFMVPNLDRNGGDHGGEKKGPWVINA